jgi:hypothetical protein
MYLPPSGKHYYSGIVLAFNTLVSKHMQATVKENSYWPGIGTAVDAVDQACKVCQQCKITAVKKIWENLSAYSPILQKTPQ